MYKFTHTPEVAEATWKTLCAKNGLPEAATIGDGVPTLMSKNELHEARKTARRAVNKITDSLKPDDYTDKVTDALMFAGEVIKKSHPEH